MYKISTSYNLFHEFSVTMNLRICQKTDFAYVFLYYNVNVNENIKVRSYRIRETIYVSTLDERLKVSSVVMSILSVCTVPTDLAN